MRANRVFELIVSRGGSEPAFLADRRRRDRLEIVSIETGEVVLFWELPAREAAKLKRHLQSDLTALQAGDFLAEWSGTDASADAQPREARAASHEEATAAPQPDATP